MQSASCAISQGASRLSQGCLPRSQPYLSYSGLGEAEICRWEDTIPQQCGLLPL